MRRRCISEGVAWTAAVWIIMSFFGWIPFFGFAVAAVVSLYDEEEKIPDWFLGLLVAGASMAAWLLLNYPLWCVLAVTAKQVHAAGGFKALVDGVARSLEKERGGGGGGGGKIRSRPAQGIALVMSSGGAPVGGEGGRTLSPSQSLKEETDNLTRFVDIRPVLEVEEQEERAADDSETDCETSSSSSSLAAARFSSVRLPSSKDLLRDDESDSTSDSDYGGNRSPIKRAFPSFSSRFAGGGGTRSRFAGTEKPAEVEGTHKMHRTSASAVDHDSTRHEQEVELESEPESLRQSAPSDYAEAGPKYPELPEKFRQKFMKKSPSDISSEATNKFLRQNPGRSFPSSTVVGRNVTRK